MAHSGWNEAWSTEAEIQLLRGLGTYAHTPRRELLVRYKRAMRLRKAWCNLDKAKIREAVDDMIQAEE